MVLEAIATDRPENVWTTYTVVSGAVGDHVGAIETGNAVGIAVCATI